METYGNYTGVFSEEILNYICPERLYPKWEKWEIKRKYGKYSAIHIDVWKPYPISMFGLLPKIPWTLSKRS